MGKWLSACLKSSVVSCHYRLLKLYLKFFAHIVQAFMSRSLATIVFLSNDFDAVDWELGVAHWFGQFILHSLLLLRFLLQKILLRSKESFLRAGTTDLFGYHLWGKCTIFQILIFINISLSLYFLKACLFPLGGTLSYYVVFFWVPILMLLSILDSNKRLRTSISSIFGGHICVCFLKTDSWWLFIHDFALSLVYWLLSHWNVGTCHSAHLGLVKFTLISLRCNLESVLVWLHNLQRFLLLTV